MKNVYKKILLMGFSLGVICPTQSWAAIGDFHTGWVGYTFDVGSAAGRILSTAVKYFLSDDTELIAELVWKEDEEAGGCGGCYGDEAAAEGDLELSAVLTDISVETEMYQAESLKKNCVADLAQQRLDEAVTNLSALSDLSEAKWTVQRQSQRRSIQALTDALNMKRIYNDLKNVATSTKSDYSNYSAAVSSVASKRLLLDELLALKKRVVAARIRTRAQTLELNGVDLQRVTVTPDLRGVCSTLAASSDPKNENSAEE